MEMWGGSMGKSIYFVDGQDISNVNGAMTCLVRSKCSRIFVRSAIFTTIKTFFLIHNRDRQESFKTSSATPISLVVIPDIFVQVSSNLSHVVLSPGVESQLYQLCQQPFLLESIEYWPYILGKSYQGGYVLVLPSQEQALYYKNQDVLYFQKLHPLHREHDLLLGKNYLRRFGVQLGEDLPVLTGRVGAHSLFHKFKRIILAISFRGNKTSGSAVGTFGKKILPDKKGFTEPLETLFKQSRQRYKKWQRYRYLFLIVNCFLAGGIGFRLLEYQDRVAQMNTIQSHLFPLTPEQARQSHLFQLYQTWQDRSTKVNFDFAQVMNRQWQQKIVITTLEWTLPSTMYGVVFHPDHQQAMESFLDWVESQHPHVHVLEKDTSNGFLRLSHPNS